MQGGWTPSSSPTAVSGSFESLKKTNEHGAEYWSARDLQAMLSYSQWRRFEQAIERAQLERPLSQAQFATHGVDLFVEELDRIVDVSREGQVEMSELIRTHLQRIERDLQGVPIKLYPFTRKDAQQESTKTVVMDPRIAFGRPILVGTAVPTAVLADRFKAGDSLTELAEDYGATPDAIEEAIRCEFDRRQAA